MVEKQMKQKPLNLCFFWHMHQPDYRDENGVMRLPWVFLHAIKDYFDMPWMMSRYPSVRATFNLTASLIEQIELYRNPAVNDHFLSLWLNDPAMLSQTEREWIIKICTSAQYETMVKPLERLSELYTKTLFDDAELLDLEVLFILAWCGNYLRRNDSVVMEMIAQGRGFDQRDKKNLLNALKSFIETILPSYALWQEEGKITVSTTPYFHPILPLLLDPENLVRANKDAVIPKGAFALEADAAEHIERSIALYGRIFGKDPNGFWPAEGAVDEKSLALYRRYGIAWVATDEAILNRSLKNSDPSLKYKSYEYGKVGMLFRDHALSDLIGFDYRHRRGAEAAADLIARLESIAALPENETVCIIVDGENAWEYYDENGWEFFTSLYQGLCINPAIRTRTMDEIFSLSAPKQIETLSPGSWIYGNFDTWANNAEKNRAWERIYQCRSEVEPILHTLGEPVRSQVRYHLLAAECSDWFWWYGDDHSTTFAEEFDALFRNHLIRVYRLCSLEVPSVMFEPVLEIKENGYLTLPRSQISPNTEGAGCFFGWEGCGVLDERKGFSTMERKRGPIAKVRFGFDETYLYFSMEGDVVSLDASSLRISIRRMDTQEETVVIPAVATGRIEWKMPRANARVISLSWSLQEGGNVLQSFPQNGPLTIDFSSIGGEDWFI